MKCAAKIWLRRGRPHPCPNNAKWRVNGEALCGVHARIDEWLVRKYGRVPINSKQGATT